MPIDIPSALKQLLCLCSKGNFLQRTLSQWAGVHHMFTITTLSNSQILFVKMTHLIRFIQLIMQEYDSKCKKMFAPITKVNEGMSNTPCSSTLEVTYSSGSGLEITKVNEGTSNTPCPSTLEVTYSSVEK
jgi:hypothetical protein